MLPRHLNRHLLSNAEEEEGQTGRRTNQGWSDPIHSQKFWLRAI